MNALQHALETEIAGNGLLGWLIALGAVVVSVAGIGVLRAWFERWSAGWAEKTTSGIDDAVVAVISRTNLVIGLAIGLFVALGVLTLDPATEDQLRRVVIGLGLVQAGLWGGGLVSWLTAGGATRKEAGNAKGVLRVLGMGAVWVFVALLLLSNLGIDVTAGIAGLGIGGVAVALAVQNVLGDLFASLSIVFDRPFVVGDNIEVDGLSGTVESIGVKTTRVRSVSGELLIFANGDLMGSRIKNFKALRERRATFKLKVSKDEPTEKLRRVPEIAKEAVEAVPDTRFERAHLAVLGDTALEYEVVWTFVGDDYTKFMDAQQAIYLDIRDRLSDEGIEGPGSKPTMLMMSPKPEPESPNGDANGKPSTPRPGAHH